MVDHVGEAVVTAGRTVASEVVVRDVVNSYDRYEELSGVSFSMPAGKVTVLMGGSRSGKTLLVRLLLGQLRPDRGQVLIDGESVWEMPDEDRRALRDRVGVLRGGYTIHESESDPRQTVVENLARRLGSSGRPGDVDAQVRQCLRDFDLELGADKTPRELNPSQRRRLCVALALVGGSPLVVIDDPGPGIDVTHLSQMVVAIKRWQTITGATLLITTHSLSVAKGLADHVVVLERGRVVADGVADELLAGIEDGREFEGRFHTRLSVREADPERLRRDAEESSLLSYLGRGLAQQGQLLLFVGLILLFALLLTGVIPLLPQPLGS